MGTCSRFVGFFKRTAWQILCWFISPTVAHFVLEPFFWLSGRRRDKKIDLSQVNRVLVIRLDDIGDVVLTIPFLRELRRNLPNAWITLLVKPATLNLVELCPYVNEVLIHKCSGQDRARKFYLYRQALAISFKHLLAQHFDLAIVPRWDVDEYYASFIAYFSSASWSVGYSENVRENKRKYNCNYDCLFTHVLEGDAIKHEVERNLDVTRFINGNVEQDKLELWLSEEDKAFANKVLQNHRVNPDSELVMFAPGANHPKRIWPIDRYVKLGLWLTQKYDAVIVVVGGIEDTLLGESLKRQIGAKVINVAGQTTLRQTAALLKCCCLFVGNDTGAMHLAAASGVPVIEISCHPVDGLLFHSNSPFRFGPWGVSSIVLQPKHATPPCSESCSAREAHCILSVAIEQAKAAVKTLLSLQ
jgi:heptosyltransferase-2